MNDRSSKHIAIVLSLLGLAAMVLLMEVLTWRLDYKLRSSPAHLAELQIRQLAYAVEGFHHDLGRYPTSEEGLRAIVEAPAGPAAGWKGPYLQRPVLPQDPWGRDYLYRLDPAEAAEAAPPAYEILSLGADGRPGGEGEDRDVSSRSLAQGRRPPGEAGASGETGPEGR